MIPILYLSHCGSSIGGGEKQLAYLVTNIDRAHYHPFVLCPDDGVFAEYLRDADIPVLILELPPWRKVKSLITRYSAAEKLVALAKTHNVQLIHTSDSWFNPVSMVHQESVKNTCCFTRPEPSHTHAGGKVQV